MSLLKNRPLDIFYALYLIVHLPATLFIDMQSLYPEWLIPDALKNVLHFWISLTNDPILQGGSTDSPLWAWIRSFIALEAVGQVPVFILCSYGLYKGSKSVEIPLLVYGVSAATTTFACLATVLALPVHAPPLPPPLIGSLALTPEQRTILLAVYTPYIIVPIFIACDMAGRLSQRGNMNTKKLY
ncbi:hypothetical protein E3Q22_01949 [Wallemia mellicola]|uniref:Efficient mitochondria targeting-associated protein 19 n=2 Tax=Wallemia mellicola TaxID=1708541 RepID=A0A4T0ST01_9BASI|nr:hypothetical protein WALSEDRAFT_67270 [Wallemia mellicola CBS 633.66]TIB73467.1 hypothetical protein E3Q23_02995 [Wallemia mellicola]EIM23638.1 hypothetical protein WALSEDRAFT_67270 [Wallemia mellicola CBS 633.66]TIB73658.1 hypothetical protein E3Q24_00999 [Wallemia mellicola]TIB80419.1 hypothetical protein E3Q22_01949 [Wallemia mellicola]TIB89337.1 hypothetical protein E3Q19_03078 [Wallemia mellicola]|eukprot:XP_006956306.1 hypothetical protein WALSEDRAFT_67270 [Wallemia mellicola CBS 633.66]